MSKTKRKFFSLFFIPFWLYLISLFCMTLALSFCNFFFIPYVFKKLLNSIDLADPSSQLARRYALLYLMGCLLLVVIYRLENYIWMFLGPRMKVRANKLCVHHVLSQKFSPKNNPNPPKMASTIKDMIFSLPKMIQSLYQGVLSGILSLIIAVLTVWQVNFTFSLGLLFWIAAFVLGSLFIINRSKNFAKQTLEVNLEIISKTTEILTNFACVKLFNNESYEKSRLKKLLNRFFILDKEKEKFKLKIFGFQGLSFVIYQAISLTWLLNGIKQGTVDVGDVGLILTINFAFVDYFRKISKELVEFSDHLGTTLKGFNTLFKEEAGASNKFTPGYLPFNGDISLHNVSFYYEEHSPVLENVNLEIRSGERVVVLGASGSGKSTFVNLMTRFCEPTEGSISFDNRDYRTFSLGSLRRSMSVVHQNTGIFSGTIQENILYGNLKASHEEMIAACKNAHIHTFIQSLPEGYLTRLDAANLGLSKGQFQRIALARALIKNAKILIFDEPISNIDPQTAHEIEENLIQLTKGKTCFFITHHLSGILASAADRVLLVQNGQIKEFRENAIA